MATFKVYILPAGSSKSLPDNQTALGNTFTGELGQNARTIVLSGTMRLYVLQLRIPIMSGLEREVKESLTSSGWNIQSVSLTRNSIFNNTLNVTIVVNALGDDISQRVDDGISNHLTNYVLDGDRIFQNVNLRVTADTGYRVSASGSAGVVIPPRTVPTPKKAAKKNAPVNVGTIATVTVSAGDDIPSDVPYDVGSSALQLPEITTPTIIVGGLFLLLFLKR